MLKSLSTFVSSFQSLPEQTARQKEEKPDTTQRALSSSSKKLKQECGLLHRKPSLALKSFSSKEGRFEILYDEGKKEFYGLFTNQESGKMVLNSWDIEGIPKKLKQCTAEQMFAFFDQVHARAARLFNGQHKIYLNVRGIGGTGPKDDFSCFLECLKTDEDIKKLKEGFELSKGSKNSLTAGTTLGIIISALEQQVEKFFKNIQMFQQDICQAIDTMLASENLEKAFYNNLDVLENQLQACQEFSKEEVAKLVNQIKYLIEEKKTASQSLAAKERFSIQSAGKNLESTVINQLNSINDSYAKTKQEAFNRLDIRKLLKIDDQELKYATLYEYFGKKLKAAESIQATAVHKKAIAEYEKYKGKLEDKTEIESKIQKLKETVVTWDLHFAKKEEQNGRICQALEEYQKYKTICKKGWGTSIENVTEKIKELVCKKDLIHKAFETKLTEIATNSQKSKEENRECFITYAWEKDVQEWIKGNLTVDLKQAGIEVKLDVWGEVRPGGDPNVYMTKIGKVSFAVMVTTPTYKDKWERWEKGEAGSGVATEIRMFMEHFNEMVTKQKGAVFVIVRNGNRENAIPQFFKFSKSLDYNKEDDYFSHTLEIAAIFHQLKEKTYFTLLERFEHERKAIVQKELTSDDYVEAKMWLKDRAKKSKLIHLPDSKNTQSVTHTVNAPTPNANFIGRKEELNQLNKLLKKNHYGVVILTSEGEIKTGKTEIAKKYFYEQLIHYVYAFWISVKDPLLPQFKKIAERLKLPNENKTAKEIARLTKEYLEKSSNWLLIFDGAEEQEALLPYLPQAGGHIIVTSRNENWLKFNSISVDVFNENDAVAFLRRIAALSHEREECALRELALELDYLPAALQEAGNQMYRRYDAGAYRHHKEEELCVNFRSVGEKSNLPEREEKFVGLERHLNTLEEKFKTKNIVAITAITDLDDVYKKDIALQYAYRNAGKKYELIWWFDATTPTSISRGYEDLAKIEVQWRKQEIKWLFIFDNAKDQKALNPYLPEEEKQRGNIIITSRSPKWVGIEKVPVKMTFSSEKAVRYFSRMVKEDNYTSEQKAKTLVEELRFSPLAIKQAAAYIVAAKTSALEGKVSIEEYWQLFKSERNKLLQIGNSFSKNSSALIIKATSNIALQKIQAEEEKEKRIPIGLTLGLMNICAQQENLNDIPKASLRKWIGQNFGWKDTGFYEGNTLARLERYALIDLSKDSVSIHKRVQEAIKDKFIKEGDLLIHEKETLQISSSFYNLPQENPYFAGRDAARKQLGELLKQYGQVVLTSKSGVKIGKTEIAKKYVHDHKQEYSHIFWISTDHILHHVTEIAKILNLSIKEGPPEKRLREHLEKHSGWLIVFDGITDKYSTLPYLPTSGGHVIITSREQNWEKLHSIEIGPFEKEEAGAFLSQISGQPHNNKIKALAKELDYLPEALQEAGEKMKSVQQGVDWYRILKKDEFTINAAYLKERSNLPHRNKKFTGRELALRRLEDTFQGNPNTPVCIAAETGLEGVGKTQIALQYAYRSVDKGKKGYDLIWWFHAENGNSIMNAYEKLAEKLSVNVTEEDQKQHRVISLILDHLKTINVKWLFIFDNAQNQEMLKPYLPRMEGNVIVTSRNRSWKEIKRLEVSTFHPEESLRYLCRMLRKKDSDSIKKVRKLAKELGHLPLALTQAVTYIERTKIPVEEYIQHLLNRRKELWLLETPLKENDYKLTVNVTCNITMQKIEEEEKSDDHFSPLPSSCALSLMNLCAYLAPNDISNHWLKEWVEQTCKKGDPSFFVEETIGRLFRYSMINSTKKFSSVHPLVQTVIRDQLSEEEQKKFIRRALHLVKEKFNSYDYNDPKTSEIGSECMPHAISVINYALKMTYFLKEANLKESSSNAKSFHASDQKTVASLLHTMGTYTLHQGNASQAKAYYEKTLEIYKTFHSEQDPSFADTLNELGNAWNDLEEKKKATQCYAQAVEIYKTCNNHNTPSIAKTLNNLGTVFSDLAQNQKAIEYHTLALDIYQGFYGDNHPSVALTLNKLGVVWNDLGEYKKSTECYAKALKTSKVFYGNKHPSTAEILNNFGETYCNLGETNTAIFYCTQALQIFETSYGQNHPQVAKTLNNLGVAWNDVGKTKKAIKYYNQAMRTFITFYGDNHRQVARTLNNLGLAWNDLVERKKAIEYYEKALEISRAFYGNNHPDIGRLLNNLGEVWSDSNQNEKAIEYLTQALKIFKEFYGDNHLAVASVLNNLGRTWNNVGQYKKAIALCEQSLNIYKCFYGTEHLAVIETLHNLGNAWSALGEYKKAIEHYQITSSFYEKRGYKRTKPKIVANNLTALATAYNKLNKYKNAIHHYKAAIEAIHKTNNVSFDALAIIVAIRCLQVCNYIDQCKYTKAKAYLSDALYILYNLHVLLKPFRSNGYGEASSISLPKTWNNVGKALKHSPQEIESAIQCLEEGLEKVSIFDATDQYVLLRAKLWNALGIVIYNSDQEENHAKKCFEKAMEGFNAFYGEKDPRMTVVWLNLAEIQRKLGNLKAALFFAESALELLKQFFNDPHPHIVQALNLFGKIYYDCHDFEKSYEYHKAALSQAKMCYPAPDTHCDKGEAYIGLGNAIREKGTLKKSQYYFVKANTAFFHVCGKRHLTIAKCSNCRGQIYEALAKKTTIPVKKEKYNRKALEYYDEAHNCAGSPKMLQIEHSAKLQLQVVNLLLFLLIRTFLAKASFLLRLAKISSCRFNKRSLGVIYPMPL